MRPVAFYFKKARNSGKNPELAIYDGTYTKFNRIAKREGITHYAESGERNKTEFHQRMESFK